MAYEKIVTVYDTEEHANEAVRALEDAGFSSSDISVMNKQTLGSERTDSNPAKQPGFWGKLFGSGVQEHEAEVYGRAVEEGGYVVTLRAPDTDVDRAMQILDSHKNVDVHERATSYGMNPGASRTLMQGAGNAANRAAGAAAGAVGAVTGTAGAAADRVNDAVGQTANLARGAAAAPVSGEEVIRLAEEQLNVGKRQVEAGTTRIRRFVTERPVEEQVSLHEEHAEVMRRAVSDPNYLGDIDWSDKTIEVKEMAEEAVVSKTARLAEEVVVRKEGSDHVETVRDKVRRQQVEVEHLDATGRPASTNPDR